MDLRRLGLFLAVVDHGGFTAAAKAVHVAQPAVSLAVRELETELGAALLVRSRGGAALTPAGRALVEPARTALRDIRTAAAAVAAVTGLVGGQLDLVSLPSLAADPLAGLVGRFRRAHPAVTVRVAGAADPVELAGMVRAGAAEVGMTGTGTAVGPLAAVPIAEQEMVAISPPGTRPGDDVLTLAALAARPLVVTQIGSSLRTTLEAALAGAGLVMNVAVEVAQRDALVPLVIAGAGTAVVPASLASSAGFLGAVVQTVRPALRRAVVLVHRPGALSPAARRFVELSTPGRARPRDTREVRPSLYEFAGGAPAFLALATAHHARCVADPELNHPFSHPDQHPQHVERLAAYWAEVLGGPPAYSEGCGDHTSVMRMHAGNGDLTDLGRRFVACFVAAADDAGLPADPEFRAALRAYMEWAVDEVLAVGPRDVVVAEDLPMPRWTWDGLAS